MFNDRDLAVLGTGCLLAAGCLLVPVPLSGRIALGAGCMALALLAAFLRLGPDRIVPEDWLLRRLRYRLRPRRYSAARRLPAPAAPERMGRAPAVAPVCPLPVLLSVLGALIVLWLWSGGAQALQGLRQSLPW